MTLWLAGTLLLTSILASAALLLRALPGRKVNTSGTVPPEAERTWQLILPEGTVFGHAEATAWFTSLVSLLSPHAPELCLAIRARGGALQLLVAAPAAWEPRLTSRLSAWLPGARLEAAAPDLAVLPQGRAVLPRRLAHPPLLPLGAAREVPEPLAGLLAALAHCPGQAGLELRLGAAPRDWPAWAHLALPALEQGQSLPPRGRWLYLWEFWRHLRRSPGKPERGITAEQLAAAQGKAASPVLTAEVAVWASGEGEPTAQQTAAELATILQHAFPERTSNTLTPARPHPRASFPLTPAELALLFHLPERARPLLAAHGGRPVATSPELFAGPAPDVVLGEAVTLHGTRPFGQTAATRRLHTYMVGKTGTGKSTLLAELLRQDLAAGRGVGLLDPHGDLAERVLRCVPPERYDAVLYFDPADGDFPIGFNPLHCPAPAASPLVASGVVGVFKQLFAESWGPRLEHFLRNTILALLETPEPSLLLIPRFLTDRAFRACLLPYVRDPLLRHFFRTEFESYDPRWRAEAVAPILNKVGQFLAAPPVRHVLGPSATGFDLRNIMDAGGIFIANLSSGRLGADNSALLGGLLMARFSQAALSRADLPEERRREFYLYVDEFQHFGAAGFAALLSEARKYGLALTLAHQHLLQLPPALQEAVLGNVGTLCVFRVGAPDAARLARELAPAFTPEGLVHLPPHQFAARLTHAGAALPAFSAHALAPTQVTGDAAAVLAASRRQWARPRAEVELEIADLWEGRIT